MEPFCSAIYVPVLRLKTGELQGLGLLADDVKRVIIPHLVVPPRGEREKEMADLFSDSESVPGVGITLGRHWYGKQLLLNPRYLFADFGDERCGDWLPRSFNIAREAGALAIPVATLTDLLSQRASAFKASMGKSHNIRIAIDVSSDSLEASPIESNIQDALLSLDVTPEKVLVLIDFSQSDLSQPDVASGVIEGAFEVLESFGRWGAIVYQGACYPESNPALPCAHKTVPRNDWKSWLSCGFAESGLNSRYIYGDYAADCAKMQFGKKGGRPRRHFRYATSEDWLVVRGADEGSDEFVMRDVARRVVDSGCFAGRSFSVADDFIYRLAEGAVSPGNASFWRAVNTGHHITRVVRDIGRMKGMMFADLETEPLPKQLGLFN